MKMDMRKNCIYIIFFLSMIFSPSFADDHSAELSFAAGFPMLLQAEMTLIPESFMFLQTTLSWALIICDIDFMIGYRFRINESKSVRIGVGMSAIGGMFFGSDNPPTKSTLFNLSYVNYFKADNAIKPNISIYFYDNGAVVPSANIALVVGF